MHCARCSLAKRSTHFHSTMSFSSTTRSAMYSPTYAPCSKPETKPEPWRVHRARPTPGSGRAHKLSPKIPLPEHGQSRRRSQSPPPSDPVPIRVHPCPSVASLQLVLRRKRHPHEEGAEFWPRMDTDGHGFLL